MMSGDVKCWPKRESGKAYRRRCPTSVDFLEDMVAVKGWHPDCHERFIEAAAELKELQAIVAELPKCWRLVDGELKRDCPVVPNTTERLWYSHPGSGAIYERTYEANMDDARSHRRGYHETVWISVADCFNSLEAAKFAKHAADQRAEEESP